MTLGRSSTASTAGRTPSSSRILVVEDEPALAETIAYSLTQEGFEVSVAVDGEAGVALFRTEGPALVILDLMLPRLPGLDVLRLIRTESTASVIILTAKDTEADKVSGLELGADDYITKPFSMQELVSRVRAHLRRAEMPSSGVPKGRLRGGPVMLDPERHEAFVQDQSVQLTPKEFELLQVLMERRGRLLTREFLIQEVWGSDYYGDTKTLDVHVKRLRQKIEDDPHSPRYLLTVRGLGYKFSD